MPVSRPATGFKHWWLLALAAVGLLAVGIDRMADRAWRSKPPDSELLLGRVHHRLQVRNPALFSDWALFQDLPEPQGPAAPAPPPTPAQQKRYRTGVLRIDASAPNSVAAALQVQWAWHCGLRRDAFDLAVERSKRDRSVQLDRALARIEKLSGWVRSTD